MSERVEINYSPGPAEGESIGRAEGYVVSSVQAVDEARIHALEAERDRLLDEVARLKHELAEARA